MRRAFLLLALSACAGPASGETSGWGFAPPDATVFAGIEWQKIGKGFEDFLKNASFVDRACFDMLTRMERIQVAVTMKGDEPQIVALLEGNFRQADMKELSRFTRTGRGRSKASESAVFFIDARHVIVGDRAEVMRAKERLKNPVEGLPAALAAAEPALRQGDFWVIGKLPNDIGAMLATMGKSASAASVGGGPLALAQPAPETPKFAVVHGMGPEPVITPVH